MRFYDVCPVPEDLPDKERWRKLRAIGLAVNKKNNHTKKVGIKNKRLVAALNDDYLAEVLTGK